MDSVEVTPRVPESLELRHADGIDGGTSGEPILIDLFHEFLRAEVIDPPQRHYHCSGSGDFERTAQSE